jgi:hypothetical protein
MEPGDEQQGDRPAGAMSGFQEELRRLDRETSERRSAEAEQAAMDDLARLPGQLGRWAPVVEQLCREADRAGLGIRHTRPKARTAGRLIHTLGRGWGPARGRKRLRLILDGASSTLRWQLWEGGVDAPHESGSVDLAAAEPEETIRDLIRRFQAWSADVAPRTREGGV